MPTTFTPSKEEFQEAIDRSFEKPLEEKLPALIRKATEKKYYTINETCKLLDVSRRHLQYLRTSGQINYIKNGKKLYFRREDLEEFFDSNYIDQTGCIDESS